METKSSMYISQFRLWLLCFIIITLVSLSSSSRWYDDHISLREIKAEETFHFPKNFLFGTASSAYQVLLSFLLQSSSIQSSVLTLVLLCVVCSYGIYIQYEGAYLTDGKTLSNWDVFTNISGKIS